MDLVRRAPRWLRSGLVLLLPCAVLAGCSSPETAPPPAAASWTDTGDGFPTPSTTGVPAGVQLTRHEGDLLLSTPGEVVENLRVAGDIRVAADDVIIRNTEVLGRVLNQDGGGGWRFRIEDSSVGAEGTCAGTGEGAIGVDHFTAVRVKVQGFSDAFRVSGDDVLIADSFVKLCDHPGSHADGVQGYYGGVDVRVLGNTIDARVSPENENAAIFFADDSRSAEVRENLLMGGGFTLRLHDEGEYAASDNLIVDGYWGYAPAAVDDCDLDRPIEWAGNKIVSIQDDYSVVTIGADVAC